MKRLLCALSASLLLAACDEASPDRPERRIPAGILESSQHIAGGEALFMRHCARCHGTVAEGRLPTANNYRPPPSTLVELTSSDPAYLYGRIEEGGRVEPYRSRGSVMPAWGPHLSEDEIWSLVAYLRARSTKG